MKTNIYGKMARYFLAALVVFIMAYPLFYVLNTSLKTNMDFIRDPVGIVKNPTLDSYVQAFEKANLGQYAFNSVLYAGVATVFSVLMAVFLAFPISRNYLKCGGLIYVAFMIGMFLPDGTVPRWQMILKAGLYNTRLGYMLTLVGGGGVTLMMFVSYIKSIPRELDEAATIDGCGYVQYTFRVLIPLMKPAIASMAILNCINVWNEVVNAVIYLSKPEFYPITRGLYVFKGDYSVQWPMLSSALVMVALPMVVLYILLQKYIIDGVVSGGVKA